jgi:hypothetical protein
MNTHLFACTSFGILAALVIAITMSPTNLGEIKTSYAQSTFDTPSSPGSTPDTDSPVETGSIDDGENFQQFMQCLFGGEASEEDISSAVEGSSDTTPTEQEIRDCFAPLYNTGGTATDTTATADTGPTEADDSGPGEDEDSTSSGETPDDEE